MKGKMELRFIAPNSGKLRSRVENPSKDLSSQLRQIFTESVAEVAEASQYEIKAKVLKRIEALEKQGKIKFNNPSHRAQVFDITGDIFNTAFTATAEEFEKRFPSKKADKDDAEKPAEAEGEAPAESVEAPAEGKVASDEFE